MAKYGTDVENGYAGLCRHVYTGVLTGAVLQLPCSFSLPYTVDNLNWPPKGLPKNAIFFLQVL